MSINIKLGLIGMGRWGKNFASTIASIDGVELSHVCTKNKDNQKLLPKTTIISEDYRSLCLNDSLSGIIIATPPQFHFEIMKDCTTYLMPFLVEKPMCMSYNETTEIERMINHAQLPCMVDYTQLFNPAFQELINRVKKQKISEIVSKSKSFGPFRKDVSMIIDWLPHDLSMCLSLLNEKPIKIKTTYTSCEEYPNSGNLCAELVFKNTTAKIYVDNVSDTKYRAFSTHGNYNTLTMFGNELYEITSESRKITVSNEQPLRKVVNTFIEAIETQVCVGIDLSVQISSLLEKAEFSSKNNSEFVVAN